MAKRKPPPTLSEIKEMSHKKYRTTSHWRKFSKTLLNDLECSCEICDKKRWAFYKRGEKKGKPRKPSQIHVHHKHYCSMGEESREDVITLCVACHKFFHSVEVMSRLRGGIYSKIYSILKKETVWEYEKAKRK